MRNIIERPHPKFKLYFDLKDNYYASNDYYRNSLNHPGYLVKENFEFEDELHLVSLGYKGHAEVKSNATGQTYTISSGKFEKLLFSDYLKLDHNNKIYFSGRFTFGRIGTSLFLVPMDLKK